MNDKELLSLWKSYDQKMDQILILNKTIAYNITRKKLNKTISSMRLPKSIFLLLGIPYVFLLCFITLLTYLSGAYVMTVSFGMISIIMIGVIIGYIYHLYLIMKISHSAEISAVQKSIAELKMSSYNIARLAIIQLPFWITCWISIEELKNSPFIYGGINLVLFLGCSYLSFWLYKNLNIHNSDSSIGKIFFSGKEWEPIIKSSDLLRQLKEYES